MIFAVIRAHHSAIAIALARQLRCNETLAERRLWDLLRDRRLASYKFRRQHPIGHFVVDCACTRHHLIVVADGGHNADNAAEERRSAALRALGWRVIGFWNNDILANRDGVDETILMELTRL